ncbi:MAG TPA: immunity 53 family protein [Longimicrobium sp.]|nr:immunity 53 family protein [Longimicrobium sp.]
MLLEALQNWYSSNCDGDWEHEYAIRITNIDNPGWSVSIPLAGTAREGCPFEETKWQRGADDWILCRVKDDTFVGHGGSRNLADIIRVFLEWVK